MISKFSKVHTSRALAAKPHQTYHILENMILLLSQNANFNHHTAENFTISQIHEKSPSQKTFPIFSWLRSSSICTYLYRHTDTALLIALLLSSNVLATSRRLCCIDNSSDYSLSYAKKSYPCLLFSITFSNFLAMFLPPAARSVHCSEFWVAATNSLYVLITWVSTHHVCTYFQAVHVRSCSSILISQNATSLLAIPLPPHCCICSLSDHKYVYNRCVSVARHCSVNLSKSTHFNHIKTQILSTFTIACLCLFVFVCPVPKQRIILSWIDKPLAPKLFYLRSLSPITNLAHSSHFRSLLNCLNPYLVFYC